MLVLRRGDVGPAVVEIRSTLVALELLPVPDGAIRETVFDAGVEQAVRAFQQQRGLITDGGLGPMTLVGPDRDFKSLAIKSTNDGRPIYAMGFGMHPTAASRWFPFLVATERLAERFGVSLPALSLEEAAPHPMWRSDVGFLGEAEVVRLLAESGDLNLFRPFPDLETSELAVLHLESRRVLGIQVKTRGVDAANPATTVNVRASSFRSSPTTYFVVLAWLRDEARFHDECLLIPSEEFRDICQPALTEGNLKFEWHPGSTAHSHLDKYRTRRADLRNQVTLKLLRDV